MGSGERLRGLGRTGGLSLDEPDMRPEPAAGSPAADAEAHEEIRQMLEAKSARSEARGQGPIDIDAEMAALTAAARVRADPGPARGGPPAGGGPQRAPDAPGRGARWTWRPRSTASSRLS